MPREDAAFALAELVFSVDNEKQRKALEKLDRCSEDDQMHHQPERLVNGTQRQQGQRGNGRQVISGPSGF